MAAHDDSRAAVALTAGGALLLYLAPSIAAGVPAVRTVLGVRDRTASGNGFALTFDDGPHPEGTPAVLRALARAGASATFFLVGEQVERRRALVAEIVAAGHEVGVHCRLHRSLLRLGPRTVRDDLARAYDAIAGAAGVEPRVYRPPYGVLNAAALGYARRRGWTTVLWTRAGRDWRAHATPASIVTRLTRGARPGDVLLLHDADYYSAPGSWRNAVGALPLLLERLEEQGLRPTRLGF